MLTSFSKIYFTEENSSDCIDTSTEEFYPVRENSTYNSLFLYPSMIQMWSFDKELYFTRTKIFPINGKGKTSLLH